MELLCGEGCVILTSTVFGWSTRVTDRQTDRRTDGRWHIARYSICCRALKILNFRLATSSWHALERIRESWRERDRCSGVTGRSTDGSSVTFCQYHQDCSV